MPDLYTEALRKIQPILVKGEDAFPTLILRKLVAILLAEAYMTGHCDGQAAGMAHVLGKLEAN